MDRFVHRNTSRFQWNQFSAASLWANAILFAAAEISLHAFVEAASAAANKMGLAHKEAGDKVVEAATKLENGMVEAATKLENGMVEAAKCVALACVVATVISTAPSWDGLILFFVAIGLLFVVAGRRSFIS